MAVQPQVRPCSETMSSGTRKTTRDSAPCQSTRESRRVWGRWSTRYTTVNAAMPRGTLIRKIQRHPAMPAMEPAPARAPPMTGPMTEEVPKTAMK